MYCLNWGNGSLFMKWWFVFVMLMVCKVMVKNVFLLNWNCCLVLIMMFRVLKLNNRLMCWLGWWMLWWWLLCYCLWLVRLILINLFWIIWFLMVCLNCFFSFGFLWLLFCCRLRWFIVLVRFMEMNWIRGILRSFLLL